MSGVAESLLALTFGDLEAIGAQTVLGSSGEKLLNQFVDWSLLDLLVERYPDTGCPRLRFEVREYIKRCGGDPLELLYLASRRLEDVPASSWNERFPLNAFASPKPRERSVRFDIADPHLHSGASIPLPLFFAALASGREPVDGKVLMGKTIRSGSGREWSLHVVLAATRWALRLMRYLRDDGQLSDVARLALYGFDDSLVELVTRERFWSGVKDEATKGSDARPLLEKMSCAFEYEGLCAIDDVFWRVARERAYEFPGRRAFMMGLVRACVAVSAVIGARPGDGLTRFVDRFDEMGLARDATLGDMKAKMTRSTLEYVAASEDVVGAEFRKTIVASSRKAFKREILVGLKTHHQGFGEFVDKHGRAMALSMPVGFLRRPCTGLGGDWTDLDQLGDVVTGYNALRLALVGDDDNTLTSAISSIDLAGDEYGSASWPFAAAAELLQRAGIELVYTIHAGEAFCSQLNGVRRVGELFLADRCPDRIGHALALSESAAKAVCAGGAPPPIRVGDAICDLSWTVLAGCGDETKARELLYELVKGAGGRALEPQVWIDAYRELFLVDALLKRGILYRTGEDFGVSPKSTLEEIALAGDVLDRAVIALVCGGPVRVAHADVTALVSDALVKRLCEFDELATPSAREHVLELVRKHKTIIEACPTSNIRLAKLDGISAHPIWQWAKPETGIKVVVGSDDPLIFGSTIADEFREMLEVADEAVVREIAFATVKACSGEQRRRLPDFQAVTARVRARGRETNS